MYIYDEGWTFSSRTNNCDDNNTIPKAKLTE